MFCCLYFRKPNRHFVAYEVRLLLSDIFVHRPVGVASAVVLSFLVHAKGVPCGGAIDVGFVYVVHAHGDTQHTAHGNQVRADVSVADRAVVCARLFITSYADLNAPYVAVKTL